MKGATGFTLTPIARAVLIYCRERYAARYAELRAEWLALQAAQAEKPAEVA